MVLPRSIRSRCNSCSDCVSQQDNGLTATDLKPEVGLASFPDCAAEVGKGVTDAGVAWDSDTHRRRN